MNDILKQLPPGVVRPDLIPATTPRRRPGRPKVHGAYSKFSLVPLEDAKVKEIVEIIRGERLSVGKSDLLYIRLLGRLLAQIELIDRYFEDNGLFENKDRGLPWPIFGPYQALVKQAARMLDMMGMTASGRARLGGQLLQDLDIAQKIQMARGEEE